MAIITAGDHLKESLAWLGSWKWTDDPYNTYRIHVLHHLDQAIEELRASLVASNRGTGETLATIALTYSPHPTVEDSGANEVGHGLAGAGSCIGITEQIFEG